MGVERNLDGGDRRPPAEYERLQPDLEFRRALAHELGNLLQVVNGNLELLSVRVQDEKLRSYIGNAQTAAHQLTRIARGLVHDGLDEGD